MNTDEAVESVSSEQRAPTSFSEVTPTIERRGRRSMWRTGFPRLSQEVGLLAAVIAFGAIITLVNPAFLNPLNLLTVVKSAVFVFIVGCAATFVFVGGGLDLSVGSVFAGGGATAGMLLVAGLPTPISFAGGVGIGALVGLANGVLIVTFGIPALIVTLGMLYIARGGIQFVTGATMLPLGQYTNFTAISQGDLFGVSNLIIYAVAIGVVSHLVLEHTPFGYHVRATGGNLSAARALGLHVARIRLTLYVLSGAAAGLAGTLMAGRLGTGDPNIAVGFELSVISAVIIGGTSMFGGIGTIFGTALGAILLAMITNGLIVMHLDPLVQQVAVGLVIIVAVGLDQLRRRRAASQRLHEIDVPVPGGATPAGAG